MNAFDYQTWHNDLLCCLTQTRATFSTWHIDTVELQRNSQAQWIMAYQWLKNLKQAHSSTLDASSATIDIRASASVAATNLQQLHSHLSALMPWRKGPWNYFGVYIDSEWQSQHKYARLQPHLSKLDDAVVLDIGGGNGYYAHRLIAAGAGQVVVVDPSALFFWQAISANQFTQLPYCHIPQPFVLQTCMLNAFDIVLSLGVLSHRRDVFTHLQDIRSCLATAGVAYLETLVIDGDNQTVLTPNDRYAAMRNVWHIPSIAALQNWILKVGFSTSRVLDVTQTTTNEQRKTPWITGNSLDSFLHPFDEHKTVEGYPAPRRALLELRQ